MKTLKLVIAWMLLITAIWVEAENKMTKLKIPYSAKEVGHCYDRLNQTLPVFQEGIAGIRAEMESSKSFEQRLQRVLSLHAGNLQTAQTQTSDALDQEEDIYMCVLYDMLESMYASEADRIAAGTSATQERRKNLDALVASIAELPFDAPQFRSAIRPRLEKVISESRKKLAEQK